MPLPHDNETDLPAQRRGYLQTGSAINKQWLFLRQVIDINPNLIFAKDREGRFTLVNQAVADIYGTTVEGLVGKTDADFNPNEEEVAFFRRMDLEVMNSLEERIIPEEVITDAKGQVHFLQTVKRPIIGADGEANQVLGVATDITERKRLEEQLRHAQKMEALGLLAGGIAHDFNNLLAVVLGNAELILQRWKKDRPDAERQVTSLELIVSSAKRAESLTRQLLSFSRRQALNPIVLDLNAVLREMEALLRRLIGEDILLHVEPQEAPCLIQADTGQIEQILMNLVVNARDAMPTGGRLEVRTDTVTLDEEYVSRNSLARVGRHTLLSVSDTGVGMNAEILVRIFEPFFTTKPLGRGTGLGLSTVYGIVKQAGGHIAVESKPAEGTTFRVFLPEAAAQVAKPARSVPMNQAVFGTETVLVCEDELPVLRLACEILEGNGYRVLRAEGGCQAMELAASHKGPIHLLLTDVVMPEINGRQLAERMLATRPTIKVLYMTGYSSDVLADGFGTDPPPQPLAKPFSPQHLLVRVRDALDT